MRPPLAHQTHTNGLLAITQLFGGNPSEETYYNSAGNLVIGHDGLDFAAAEGEDVYPAAEGRVTIRDSRPYGFGLYAILTDAAGNNYLYGHLSALYVHDGALVQPHTRFAAAGSTGNSSGPHVHFGYYPAHESETNGYAGAVDPIAHFDADVPETLDLSLTNL